MQFPPVLVLGATGRIGAVLRRIWPADAARWQTRRPMPGTGWALCDPLADPAGLARAATGCSAILCLAGPVPGQGGEVDLDVHVPLALAAVAAAAAADVPVLLVSSAAVYGAQSGLLSEAAPLVPMAGYGRVKVEMEQQAATLADRLGVAACALRIGNIAGLDAILGGWRTGFTLDRFADGHTPRRSYIGVRTLAQTLLLLARQRDLPAALNVAAPGLTEMGALLDAAGLPWTPRTPSPAAIPEVALDVRALQSCVPLAPGAGLPHTLVAEWRKTEIA